MRIIATLLATLRCSPRAVQAGSPRILIRARMPVRVPLKAQFMMWRAM